MTFRFEIVNNSLVITDTSTSTIVVEEPKQTVYYNSTRLQQGEVLIQKVSLPYSDNVLFRQDISSCVNSTNTPFTESTFRQFAWENLGRSINTGSGGVNSVNGRTGDVVLTSSDVGLDNVDNTSDLDKPISTATQTEIDNLKSSTGWWLIEDNTFTSGSPQSIPSNTRTKLQINSDTVVETYGANGLLASSIWDDVNYRITPLSIGDSYTFRVAFNVDPVQNNRNFTVDLDVSGTTGIILEKSFRLLRGANNDTKVDITSSIFPLSDFVTNGGEIYITCDGLVRLFDIKLYIQKVTQND